MRAYISSSWPDSSENSPPRAFLSGFVASLPGNMLVEPVSCQQAWYLTREAIKEWVEGPDEHMDRIIRAIRQHGGVSGKLRRDFPVLDDPVLVERLETIVAEGFTGIGRIE